MKCTLWSNTTVTLFINAITLSAATNFFYNFWQTVHDRKFAISATSVSNFVDITHFLKTEKNLFVSAYRYIAICNHHVGH